MSAVMPYKAEVIEMEEEHYKCCVLHPDAPLVTLREFNEEKTGVRVFLEIKTCSKCKDDKRVRDRKFVFLLEISKNDEVVLFVVHKAYTISDARKNWFPGLPHFIPQLAKSLSDETLREEQTLASIFVGINDDLRDLVEFYRDETEEPR